MVFEAGGSERAGILTLERSGVGAGSASVLVGTNAPTLTFTGVAWEDAGQYQCAVYDNVLDETTSSQVVRLQVDGCVQMP